MLRITVYNNIYHIKGRDNHVKRRILQLQIIYKTEEYCTLHDFPFLISVHSSLICTKFCINSLKMDKLKEIIIEL